MLNTEFLKELNKHRRTPLHFLWKVKYFLKWYRILFVKEICKDKSKGFYFIMHKVTLNTFRQTLL